MQAEKVIKLLILCSITDNELGFGLGKEFSWLPENQLTTSFVILCRLTTELLSYDIIRVIVTIPRLWGTPKSVFQQIKSVGDPYGRWGKLVYKIIIKVYNHVGNNSPIAPFNLPKRLLRTMQNWMDVHFQHRRF